MITVTERAKRVLKAMLIATQTDPNEGLRFMPISPDEFALVIGDELSGDQIVEYEGLKVLFVGIEYFNMLNGAILDCYDNEQGSVLTLRMQIPSR